MGNNIFKICLLALVFMGFTSHGANRFFAQDADSLSTRIVKDQNYTFVDGEEIVYKLFYKMGFIWLSAGEVVFTVQDVGDQFHFSAVGTTYPGYEWFFKVRDYYDSYVDKETLLPDTSIRDISEGTYTLYDKVVFDKENNVATSYRGRSKDKAVAKEVMVDDYIHDMLSSIYYVRNMDLNNMEMGESFPMNIFLDKKTYKLDINYNGKEKGQKIHGLGKFNTIKLSPQLIAGQVFEEGSVMDIYVSDDGNRVPLMITSPVSVGSIRAVLKSHSGLKYGLTEAKK